jgi:hypothetical protein
VLSWFGKREKEAVVAYRRFVAEGLGEGRRPDLVGGGLVRSLVKHGTSFTSLTRFADDG